MLRPQVAASLLLQVLLQLLTLASHFLCLHFLGLGVDQESNLSLGLKEASGRRLPPNNKKKEGFVVKEHCLPGASLKHCSFCR